MPERATDSERYWLFWDGECGFCRECVEWVRRRDRAGLFDAIPYQEAPSPPMTDALRECCRDAVCVMGTDGQVLAAGAAVAFVLEKLGYRRLGRLMASGALLPVVEWGYRRVANNRGWLGRLLFGRRCAT